jgi:general secretion pathway protein G
VPAPLVITVWGPTAKNNMKMSKSRLGFTLLEILLVITIIGLILAIGTVSYSQVIQTSRDSTRKTDTQEISNALEQFKSNNEFGSYPSSIYGNSDFTKYITSIPTDPKTRENYNYVPFPSGCSPSIDTPCTSYNISATLEKDLQEYTVNPYGEQ